MRITEKWITEKEPCEEAIEWWDKKERDPIKILRKLIKEKRYDWANWFIVRVMNYKGYVSYAIYAAERVINLFEKQYPEDKRPRQAIEAAKKCIKNSSETNNSAADSAAHAAARAAYSAAARAAYRAADSADCAAYSAAARAAEAAARAAYSADSAADSADCAAYSAAARAAEAAARAAYSADSAANSAAACAADAAYHAARNKMKLKILRYGMKLLKEDNNGKD